MNVILLGPPGSGKGTQAELLSARFGLSHISTGDLFRKHLGEGTALGKLARSYMDRGELVPDQVTVSMVETRLDEGELGEGVLLDGFPRTIAQATALDELLEARDERLDAVVLLQVPDEELIERLTSRGRADDTPETVRTRLEVYREQTQPLVAYYQERDLLRPVDGVGEIDAIAERIAAKLAGTEAAAPGGC